MPPQHVDLRLHTNKNLWEQNETLLVYMSGILVCWWYLCFDVQYYLHLVLVVAHKWGWMVGGRGRQGTKSTIQ